MKNMIKKCIVCEKEFEAVREDAKFCSDACQKKLSRTKTKDVGDKSEINVGDKFYCKKCGKELNERYGKIAHLVDVCHDCLGREPLKGEPKVTGKGMNGDDLFFCSEHQEHTLKYCKAMCDNNCHHII
jgi:hypothetical protein